MSTQPDPTVTLLTEIRDSLNRIGAKLETEIQLATYTLVGTIDELKLEGRQNTEKSIFSERLADLTRRVTALESAVPIKRDHGT